MTAPARVLVTGGSGRFGRFMVAEMLAHAEVTVLDLAAPVQDVAFVQASVLDLDAVRAAVRGHDAVIHLAGIDSGTPASEHDYFHVNVQGTWNALAAAEEAGIARVPVCSSIAAYGLEAPPPHRRAPLRLPVDEDHPLRPEIAYDLSKATLETVAAAFARRGMTVPCLRPAWIIFHETAADHDRRLREADGSEGAGEAPGTHRPPPPLRAWVRPDDCARAFRLALTAGLAPCEPLNIGADDVMGATHTLDAMARSYGAAIPGAPLYAAHPRAAAFSPARARARLGWQPTGDWAGFVADPPPTPGRSRAP